MTGGGAGRRGGLLVGTLSVTALLLLASGGAGVALVLTAAAGALGVRTGPAGVLTVTLRS